MKRKQWWEFITHLVPDSVFGPFVEGDILQVIFLAVIFGVAINAVGQDRRTDPDGVERLTAVVFKVLGFIMKLAPLGAFGAMAFAIGKYGVSTLTSLGSLILLFYVTSAFFVFVVLGSVMAYLRLNIFRMLGFFKEELLLILGTSTAEPALPGLMRKLEYAGVKKPTVGLVVPTGYSFNLDGAAIYLSLAALYIAQATNTDLSIPQQLGLLGVMLLTSKGAAGVAGGGFIALTATLSTLGTIPAAGIMLIFGIDKFMSECRALVNFIGNAVATLFVAKWNHELDVDRARRVFSGEVLPPPDGDVENDFDMEILEQEHGTSTPHDQGTGRGPRRPRKARPRDGARALRTAMTALRTAREKGRPMKVLVAPDKFKGSLSAAEVAEHLAAGLASAGIESTQLPLADGGDGSVDAAVAVGFTPHPVTVAGATGTPHAVVSQSTAPQRWSRSPTPAVWPPSRAAAALRSTPPASVWDKRSRRRCGFDPAGWSSPWAGPPAPTAEWVCSPRWDSRSPTPTAGNCGPAAGPCTRSTRSIPPAQ